MDAFDIVRQTDALILDLHGLPVERRRRVVKGSVRRLIRNSGVHRLDLVIIDQSSREHAEASLEHLFASVLDVVRVCLADPILEDRVAETIIDRIAEIAADLDGRDRKKLIDAIRWAGW